MAVVSKRSDSDEMQIINFTQNCQPIKLHTLIRLERKKGLIENNENNPFILFC